ncbi:MAM domain-containing glycosylphosphatidylinositol anchor protein 1 [Rhinophrynus dorsalis]
MEIIWLFLFYLLPRNSRGQGVYAPAQAQIIHAGQACVVKEDNISERLYTIREGDTLVLQCLVTGHPRPQVRWTKTAGSASEKFQETSIYNETLRIEKVQRMQGGRYYCKAENGVGVPAIKSIRVDVQYLDEPILTIHQTISDVRGSFYQEKTVFLRCTVSSNPPARFIWKRGTEILSHNQDNGVDIYEPLYTQGETKVLKLKNLRPQDYANYTCRVSVRNVCGIPDKSITFRLTNKTGAAWWGRDRGGNQVYRSKKSIQSPLWIKAEAAPPALKMSVNETLVVNPGDNVTMQCSLTGGDPPPQIVWSHAPNVMSPNSFSKGGNLTIWMIRPEDSGFYNCTAINNVGNPAKKTVNLLVRSMKNATFQITPDVIKESETIQLGQDLKLSCHVDAVPQEKVVYAWYKNQKAAKTSDRLLITRNDPDLPPVTSSLEIIDLRFSDYGTYMCVASFPGLATPELSIEVNISAETVPPTLSVPKGQSVITVREGSRAELQCEVRGKPKPPILWTRVDREGPLPSGDMVVETYDGKLRLDNVTRDMSGTYKCQTARYNGFNIRPREALVQLNMNLRIVMSKSIPVRNMQKGLLQEYVLRDLKVPQNYHVHLTPYTIFGAGDPATRILRYTEPINYPNPYDNTCEFEDEKICGFVQDQMDNFDWIRQNVLTQNPKRSANTGPKMDRNETPEGYYMFLEASSPRVQGDKARLISPMYNVTAKSPSNRMPYCVSFYYHMYGRHIGSLNVLVRLRNIGTMDTQEWTLSGDRGNKWQHAIVPIKPSGPFQVVFEGVRGPGIEGDIAIDDVTVKKGECPRKQFDPTKEVAAPGSTSSGRLQGSFHWPLSFFLFMLLR